MILQSGFFWHQAIGPELVLNKALGDVLLRRYNQKKIVMSQVVLEFSNQNDLALLLSFAKRLKVRVVSIKNTGSARNGKKAHNDKLLLLQKAVSDPLFLSDIEEVMHDFAHADEDEI